MTSAAELNTDGLANRCIEETAKYRQHGISDTQFCFELFRRALADGLPEALRWMFEIYEPQAQAWVYHHSRFSQTNQSADVFASEALHAFYFAAQGLKFSKFPSLSHVLAYMRACVHTAIALYLRNHQHDPAVDLASVQLPGPDVVEARVNAHELWQEICAHLPQPRDQQLARCVFALNMRPREIVVAYPELWASEREISVALYRIRSLLRTIPELRRRAGLEDEQEVA